MTVERGTAATPEIAIRTDAAGRCGVALPPGRFTLAAFHAGASGRVDTTGENGDITIVIGGEETRPCST